MLVRVYTKLTERTNLNLEFEATTPAEALTTLSAFGLRLEVAGKEASAGTASDAGGAVRREPKPRKKRGESIKGLDLTRDPAQLPLPAVLDRIPTSEEASGSGVVFPAMEVAEPGDEVLDLMVALEEELAKPHTSAEVTKAVIDYARSKGAEQVTAGSSLLKEFGATRTSLLKPGQYAAVMARIAELSK